MGGIVTLSRVNIHDADAAERRCEPSYDSDERNGLDRLFARRTETVLVARETWPKQNASHASTKSRHFGEQKQNEVDDVNENERVFTVNPQASPF